LTYPFYPGKPLPGNISYGCRPEKELKNGVSSMEKMHRNFATNLLLIFLSSYLLIFLTSYLLIFLSSYLLIFLSSYLLIFLTSRSKEQRNRVTADETSSATE